MAKRSRETIFFAWPGSREGLTLPRLDHSPRLVMGDLSG